MLKVNKKHVLTAAYLYLIIPIIVFFLTWLRPSIAFPTTLILLYGFYVLLKQQNTEKIVIIKIPLKTFVMIVICIMFFVWTSGVGGFFYQTYDQSWRNAVLRDMVNFSWPVQYPLNECALNYYLMFWIVPALVGKIAGWTAANIALYIWSVMGIVLVFLLLAYVINSTKKRNLYIICFFILFWSGLNLIGWTISDTFGFVAYHFFISGGEGWLDFTRNGYDCSYLYRNNFDSLSQIFNQVIPLWVGCSLFIHSRKHICNFAFIGLCILPYAPIPFLGIFPIFIFFGIVWLYRNRKDLTFNTCLKNIFSITNISAIVTIFPILYLYFSCNANASNIGLFVPWIAFDIYRIATLLLFYLIEFGIVALIIYKKNKHNALFFFLIVELIIIPLFRVGTGRDFCMNASLSALFFLMVMTIQYTTRFPKLSSGRKTILVAYLTLMILSPLGDLAMRTSAIYHLKQFPLRQEVVVTFSDKLLDVPYDQPMYLQNFLIPNYNDMPFYKYLARKKVEIN